MTHTLEITEESRQLLLLALALMVVGPRPGFDYAARLAAEELRGRDMYARFKRLNGSMEACDQPFEVGGES